MAVKKPAPSRTSARAGTAKAGAAKAAVAAKPAPAAKKPAARKPAARKEAARKPAAKKPAAKKAAAKKPAARKPAAVNPPVTKPAAKKPAAIVAKPPATSKKASVKKPAAKAGKPAADAAPSRKTAAAAPSRKTAAAASKAAAAGTAAEPQQVDSAVDAGASKVPFRVGDKVVYPHHGAATIIKKERIEFGGEKHDYFVLEVATDQLTVRVPTNKALDLGVRPVISKNVARKVFATFKDAPQEAGANWSRWYKLLTEKINSGDIFQVAEVVRDLTYAQQVKGISPALKRMLAKARLIIVSELRFALALDEEEAVRRLDRALPRVEEPIEA
ncbi:MAG TPA: CarD family transcriptional regulator [Acidimicrobiia bacterium]